MSFLINFTFNEFANIVNDLYLEFTDHFQRDEQKALTYLIELFEKFEHIDLNLFVVSNKSTQLINDLKTIRQHPNYLEQIKEAFEEVIEDVREEII